MNPVPLFLIIVTLPLLLGGCGENNIKPKLKFREGIGYLKESNQAYTGIQTGWYRNGRKKFEIHFKNGKEHGQGTLTHPSGQKYVGEYKYGKIDGRGTMTFPDGRVESGLWRENQFLGNQ